jgi:hypothetical protein
VLALASPDRRDDLLDRARVLEGVAGDHENVTSARTFARGFDRVPWPLPGGNDDDRHRDERSRRDPDSGAT